MFLLNNDTKPRFLRYNSNFDYTWFSIWGLWHNYCQFIRDRQQNNQSNSEYFKVKNLRKWVIKNIDDMAIAFKNIKSKTKANTNNKYYNCPKFTYFR